MEMMSEFVFRSLTDSTDEALIAVADHFQLMYSEFDLPNRSINDEGKALWLEATKRSLGRTLFVQVAELRGEVIASVHGNIVVAPAYLGGARSAIVQHIYVPKEHRSAGIAKELAMSWMDEMKEKGIEQFQLQVTEGNDAGMAFWKSLGFEMELSQLAVRIKLTRNSS
jgi:ribosomal protein S18 acetylase RimI-like enzyme